MEDFIAKKLINLSHYAEVDALGSDAEIEQYEILNKITLHEKQREAVLAGTNEGVVVITGGPGTGKTTTLINIAADAIKNGKRVLYISNNDSTLSNVYSVFKEYDLHSFVSNLSNSFSKVNEKPTEVKRVQIYEGMVKESLRDNYFEIDKNI